MSVAIAPLTDATIEPERDAAASRGLHPLGHADSEQFEPPAEHLPGEVAEREPRGALGTFRLEHGKRVVERRVGASDVEEIRREHVWPLVGLDVLERLREPHERQRERTLRLRHRRRVRAGC